MSVMRTATDHTDTPTQTEYGHSTIAGKKNLVANANTAAATNSKAIERTIM